ncbi:MAG TPA: DUF3667 domain-containing protein [Thermoanaerobaculia bacterium]|nr:DUF3667 domain-containing protein [Thermoanaerobaculia bacterium]
MSHGEAEPNCLNCGVALQGDYCHACGQKAVSLHLGMHDFAHDATHEFLHLDGKVLKTVRLLIIRPGELTREFLAGRRARYISPVRLYLTFSLIFFTLAAILPHRPGDQIVKVQGTPNLHAKNEFERRLMTGLQKAQREGQHTSEEVLHNVPKAMFVLMPIFALLTWAFYRKQQRFYVPHLYYAVHFHAFVFFVMSVYVLVSRLALTRAMAAPLILVTVPYHFIALRRVFGGSRAITFAKGFAIGFLYWLTAAVTLMVVALIVILSL